MSNENESKSVSVADLASVVGGGFVKVGNTPKGEVRTDEEGVEINGSRERVAPIETAPPKGPSPLPPGFPGKIPLFWNW